MLNVRRLPTLGRCVCEESPARFLAVVRPIAGGFCFSYSRTRGAVLSRRPAPLGGTRCDDAMAIRRMQPHLPRDRRYCSRRSHPSGRGLIEETRTMFVRWRTRISFRAPSPSFLL